MSRELSVALVQMTSIDDVAANLEQIKNQIFQIHPSLKPRLICLPENSLYMRTKEGEAIKALRLNDSVFAELSALARKENFFIHVGSVPLDIDGKVFNSSVLITDLGGVQASYQKMHLFDIHLEGQKPIRESDVFTHGAKPSTFEIDGWKFGETICYDLRFAELYSQYAKQGVDVILIPSAFLPKTGEAHWDVLMRARAIESQAYVLAAAQGGSHIGKNGGVRETYGNSLVVDPWGQVLTRADHSPSVILATLSKERIEVVRRQIPMKSHRRI